MIKTKSLSKIAIFNTEFNLYVFRFSIHIKLTILKVYKKLKERNKSVLSL